MSQLETLIDKATDGTLTTDNWQYILDVCDCISANPETNTKAAIKLVQKRLAMKDANVILRTLSLLLAIAENCGSRMKQEIASTSFLQDSLLKRLGDRKLHKQVKFRIAEVISQLNSSFENDPSLKPIKDAYSTVKSKYSQYLNSPPSKPDKQELSASEKRNEELEMERALKLSVQEYEREQTLKKSYLNSKPLPASGEAVTRHSSDVDQKTQNAQIAQNSQNAQNSKNAQNSHNANNEDQQATIASVKKVCALYDLISYEPDELSFKKGDIITVIESVYRDWWRGLLPSGKVGIFPLNYVTPVITKTPEELAREAAMENYVQDVELKKVEKLLALLSSNPDQVPEDEVTQLYNEIIPLRTNLAKFIDKYSSRKDELRILHDQLNNETKLYNGFIDNVVSQRSQIQFTGPLPYPANYDQSNPHGVQGVPQQKTGYLEQQPTSAGFGNAYGPPPQVNVPTGFGRDYQSRPPTTTFNQYPVQQNTPGRQPGQYPQY